MGVSEEIKEILNEICFMSVPYETRVEMCDAVVRAANTDADSANAINVTNHILQEKSA